MYDFLLISTADIFDEPVEGLFKEETKVGSQAGMIYVFSIQSFKMRCY